MNEQELCKKKLIDLSRQANRKGIVLFSDFLNLNELNIYHQNEKFFETKTEASGGVPFAERQIVAFIPDALYYEWTYPIDGQRHRSRLRRQKACGSIQGKETGIKRSAQKA